MYRGPRAHRVYWSNLFQLVGHVIKGGGLAISGQDQTLLYKKDNIEPAPSKCCNKRSNLKLRNMQCHNATIQLQDNPV